MSKELILNTAIWRVAQSLHDYYLIAEECKGSPLNERVWIDHHTDGDYVGRIGDAFNSLASNRATGAPLVKQVKTIRSQSEDLVQLADMVCGAVRRYYGGDREFYRLIEGRRNEVATWP